MVWVENWRVTCYVGVRGRRAHKIIIWGLNEAQISVNEEYEVAEDGSWQDHTGPVPPQRSDRAPSHPSWCGERASNQNRTVRKSGKSEARQNSKITNEVTLRSYRALNIGSCRAIMPSASHFVWYLNQHFKSTESIHRLLQWLHKDIWSPADVDAP